MLTASALASVRGERLPISVAVIFLGLGFVLGPRGVGLIEIDLHDETLQVVATVTLALVLFLDAVRIQIDELRTHRALPVLILGPGTLLIIAADGGGALLLFGLPPAGALLIVLIRPAVLSLVLARAHISGAARTLVAWFGPSGLNSLVLVLVLVLVLLAILAGVPDGERIFSVVGVVGVVVLVSALAHGISGTPLAGWYARRGGDLGGGA